MTESQIQTIKKIIEDILDKLTIEASVEVIEVAEGPRFTIRTPEGGLLIGEGGKNLISLNHLVKKISSHRIYPEEKKKTQFSLDVNDYQAKRMEDLRNIARVNAQRVRYFKKEVVLRTMTSFERRVIHATLSDSPDITTESQGREPRRQVVIKPYP
jgi:spoIIIJ-associated protein